MVLPSLLAAAVEAADPVAPGAITGALVSEQGLALPGVPLRIECDCTAPPRTVVTGTGGRFELAELAPGTYRLSVPDSDPAVEREILLRAGDTENLVIAAPGRATADRRPDGRIQYSGFSGLPTVRQAQAELATGGVLLAAAFACAVGAAVEASGPDCAGGPGSCDAPRRDAVAVGLAVASGLTGAAGVTLTAVGGVGLRRARLELAARPTGALLRLRF
jgi:hypothetical protein